MTKVFITGITGFVGSELARQMRDSRYSVVGTSTKESNEENCIQCDIRNADAVLKTIAAVSPDIIIHNAALSLATHENTRDYYENNVLGTENVIKAINALKQRKKIIFISTAGVYGNHPVGILSEDLSPLPVTHYGMSKFVCERMIMNEIERHDVMIIRPFNIIGRGQNPNFIVPKLVWHFAHAIPSIRLGNLDPIRDYIDLKTSCTIIGELIMNSQAYGEIINLCSGAGTSVRDLLNVLYELTGHAIQVITAPEFTRRSEVWSLLGCTKKLDRLLPNRGIPCALHEVLSDMLSAFTEKSS